MTHRSYVVKGLSNSLKEMQSIVIGVFRPRFGNVYEPAIDNNEGVLETITVGTLLGCSTLTIEASQGRYVPFLVVRKGMLPTNHTFLKLSEMMNEPVTFANWYKYFVEEGHDVYNDIHPENCKYPTID